MTTGRGAYPPIGDYALIGDCHSAALVSTAGSVDWCCMPRFDSASCFGRLLDWQKGGFCAVTPLHDSCTTFRRYVGDSLVLETTFRTSGGEVRVLDCFAMRAGGRLDPRQQLLRVIEGVRGRVDLHLHIAPRFDYGSLPAWIRHESARLFSAIGGDNALFIYSDADLVMAERHDLEARFTVRAGERIRTSIRFHRPESLDLDPPRPYTTADLDERLQETLDWWHRWSDQAQFTGPDGPAVLRSSITLKALTNATTGAITAAPTTSLPERIGGERNWDYRYSWIRDSSFTVRSLSETHYLTEADSFRKFIQRSSAGSAHDLQIMYGVGGERRLTEMTLDHLEGYRGSGPVRIGNGAATQLQLDAYGELLDLTWRWHLRGSSPDDDYWRFLTDLVDVAAERWQEPDRGIWEIRGEPKHFVHSKVMCWAALDRGLRLAKECLRKAPERRWAKTRDAIRAAIESEGYDAKRGIFTQTFGAPALDAALLLLPSVDFVDYEDPRMVRTVDAIAAELDHGGLLLRYKVKETDDGLAGEEGTFLACTFWLAECLARQGRLEEARTVFDRVASSSNDLGLFAEEYDPKTNELLGNFPQGLTHLSHIAAALALADAQRVHTEPVRR